jgi:hypothetical protein
VSKRDMVVCPTCGWDYYVWDYYANRVRPPEKVVIICRNCGSIVPLDPSLSPWHWLAEESNLRYDLLKKVSDRRSRG